MENTEVEMTLAGEITDAKELLNLLGRKFKMAQKALKMEPIGKKYFNPNKKIPYPKHSIEIWPGYVTAVNLINNRVFVNVDLSFKVIRKVNAL